MAGATATQTKRKGRAPLVFVAILVILAIVAVLLSGVLGGTAEAVGATVSVVQSALETQKGGTAFAAAIDGDLLGSGDKVRADTNGRGFLTFFDGSTAEVEPGSQLAITQTQRGGDGSVVIRVEQSLGIAWFNVQKLTNPNSRFEVKTPAATAVVRGTAFKIFVLQDGTMKLETHVGEVIVDKAGQQQTVPQGFEITTPPDPAPPPPPVRTAPKPGLRFTSSAGVGLIVRDPRGLSCGSGRAEIPSCREVGVIIGEAVPGEYAILLTAAQAGTATLTVDGLVGDERVSGISAQRTVQQGELVRTSVRIGIEGGKPTVGQLSPFESISNVCGVDVTGKIATGGTFADRLKSLNDVPAGQAAAFIAGDAELTAAAQDAVKQAKGLPVQVSDVKVNVGVGGLRFSANVAAGPLTVPGSAEIIAGASGGKLVMKVKSLNLGPAPAAVSDQFRTQLEQSLASVAKDVPLDVERVSFRAGCFGIIGKKR